jgi:hypothetical protein
MRLSGDRLCFPTALVALLGFVFAGCGGSAGTSSVANPGTFPVKGRVIVADGQPALAGGTIMFEPVDGGQFSSLGEVQSDGTFALHLVTPSGDRLEGAVPGEHRVTLTTPIGADQSGGASIALSKTYTVKSEENNFEVKVETLAP